MRHGLFAGWLVLLPLLCQAEPAPTPPAWQRDLDAALALQTALALVPAADPRLDADRRERLGQLYGQLVTRYPDQATVQKAAGSYYSQAGEIDAAVVCWQRAQTLAPEDAPTADNLGSAFLSLGKVRQACEQFERAVETRPEVAAYHFDLANVLYLFRKDLLIASKRPDEQAALAEALEQFRLAAELAPNDLRLAQGYAETFDLLARPDWMQALAAWKSVLALSGGDTDLVYSHLARVSLRLGRPADMETYLAHIHSPAFAPMKASFRQRAAAVIAAATPTPSPSAVPQ